MVHNNVKSLKSFTFSTLKLIVVVVIA